MKDKFSCFNLLVVGGALAFGSLFKFDDTLGTPSLAAATSSDILVISAVYNGSVLLCGWTFYTL